MMSNRDELPAYYIAVPIAGLKSGMSLGLHWRWLNMPQLISTQVFPSSSLQSWMDGSTGVSEDDYMGAPLLAATATVTEKHF